MCSTSEGMGKTGTLKTLVEIYICAIFLEGNLTIFPKEQIISQQFYFKKWIPVIFVSKCTYAGKAVYRGTQTRLQLFVWKKICRL